ncbi:MAG TPA: hypothetical protein PKK61_01470 [Defluviitaleaceae bacterium]|nr:hypothetical protein [Defluviitaleaceae bacterium]
MKYRFFMLIIMLLVFFSLAGCDKQDNSRESMNPIIENSIDEENINKDLEDENKSEPIESDFITQNDDEPAIVINGVKTNEWLYITEDGTKLREYSIDLDSDGEEEKIQLYTSTARDESGELLWDDNQNWLLLIEDGNEYYPLFESPVQLGMVYFNVFYDSNELAKVSLILSAGASMKITNYYYDEELGGYIVDNIYEEDSINAMYSSIPYY